MTAYGVARSLPANAAITLPRHAGETLERPTANRLNMSGRRSSMAAARKWGTVPNSAWDLSKGEGCIKHAEKLSGTKQDVESCYWAVESLSGV